MPLKMNERDYNHIKTSIRNRCKHFNCSITEDNDLWNNKGLSDERFRWDLFDFGMEGPTYCCKVLYTYLYDDHIDSALKRIVKELKIEERDANLQQK